MNQPLEEYSAARIGRPWKRSDHEFLVHTVREIDRAAQALCDRYNEVLRLAEFDSGKDATAQERE